MEQSSEQAQAPQRAGAQAGRGGSAALTIHLQCLCRPMIPIQQLAAITPEFPQGYAQAQRQLCARGTLFCALGMRASFSRATYRPWLAEQPFKRGAQVIPFAFQSLHPRLLTGG